MKNILVVDDNEQNLYLLQTLLTASGYHVIQAANGEEALEAARAAPPDMIISDILMPMMDGFTLCKRWKAAAEFSKIPFVFYTATYTDKRDEDFALSLGADRFIRKPSEPDAFVEMVRDVIQQGTAGMLTANPPPEIDEAVELKQYNQVLLRKLEAKMLQLEVANRALEQRVAERTADLEERNRTLEAFSHSVAHDLGAPLRAIEGIAEIVNRDEQDQLSPKGRENLQLILDSTRRARTMMADLLRYARLGIRGLDKGPVALTQIVEQVRRDLAQRIDESNADLQVTGDWPAVQGESTLLMQILANLISNALTYRQLNEPPRVELSCQTNQDRVIVAVRDNGIGIRPEHQEKIFTVFQRLHSQDKYPGSGIGLAIVERAVRLLAGRVWVESTPGQGSVFFVELPAAKPDAEVGKP